MLPRRERDLQSSGAQTDEEERESAPIEIQCDIDRDAEAKGITAGEIAVISRTGWALLAQRWCLRCAGQVLDVAVVETNFTRVTAKELGSHLRLALQ